MSVAEEKEVKAAFPENDPDKTIAGKAATFFLKLVEIKKKQLPEPNDIFANQVKDGSTILSLRTEIRENIRLSKEEDKKQGLRDQVMEHLLKKNPVPVPNSMIEQQARLILSSIKEDFKRKGQALPELKEEDAKQLMSNAERMVRTSLVLKNIALKEKIALDEARVKSKIQKFSEQIKQSNEETEKLLAGRGMLDRIKDEILTDQVFEFLVENASIN
jgi:trigger factor